MLKSREKVRGNAVPKLFIQFILVRISTATQVPVRN